MMCSTWKISVFGIVALMLSFGLVAGDAWAHSDGSLTHPAGPNAVNHYDDATLTVSVYSSVSTDPPNPNGNGDGAISRTNVPLKDIPDGMKLRATEILDSIVFTYTPGVTTAKAKNIVLTIPGGWTQPVIDNIDGINEAGEITINQGTVSIGAGGGGWQLSTGNYDPAPSTQVVITYKRVTVPRRAGAYQFNFTSNVVGAGHASRLDSHLLLHAKQVGADQGGHTHGDLGSLDLVESHAHPSATWTITLAIHTHDSDGSITHVAPHTHTPTEDTTDAADVTILTPIVDHAHSGAGEAVIAAHAHTHPGDSAESIPAGDHNHAGNGADVSVAVVHAHDVDKKDNPTIEPHTHPGAAMNANMALPHSHTAAETANAAVDPHTHESNDDGDGTTVSSHTHGGTSQGVTSVLNHAHASEASEYDSTTYTLGALHAHTGNNGRVSAVPAHLHKYNAGDSTTTKDEIIGHTHTVPDKNAAVRTGASEDGEGPVHAHATAIGAVQYSSGHSHLAPEIVAGSPNHRHSAGFKVTLPPLNTHTHDGQDNSDILHEHTSTYRAVIYPTGHSHATVDTAGGSPIHRHGAVDDIVYGAPMSPYTVFHKHSAIDKGNTHSEANSGKAPVHTHTADYARVEMAPSHTHAAAPTTGSDTKTTGVSSGGIVHRHSDVKGGSFKEVKDHSHAADTGLSSAFDLHTHTGTGMPDAVEAHKHTGVGDTGAGGDPLHQHAVFGQGATGRPLGPIDSHSHSSYSASAGEPIHTHMADYDGVASPQTHQHVSPDATAGVIPHSHSASYLSLLVSGAHSHATEQTPAGSPLHNHVANFTAVEIIGVHQHTSIAPNNGFPAHSHHGLYSGEVRVSPSHSHADGLTNHVAQNSLHVHTLDHNGRYVMNVGPAPSGSGSLVFHNTGSPTLAPHDVDGSPYKDKYLVHKGQVLGDLVLTYTAAGTMMKGSGIRILTSLPIDQGFYLYNMGGPGGGVRLERGSAEFAVDPVSNDADGISANSLFVKTTASLEAGSQIGFRVRNLSLRVHGTKAGEDPTPNVTDYTLAASSSSPLAADGAAILADVGGAPTFTVTGAHMSGEMKLKARGIDGDLTHATAGEDLGSLIFTFNTKQPMATGANVQIELPQNWSIPFHATSTSDARSGAITLAGSATLIIKGMVLTATTTTPFASDFGGALVFTYKAVKAPATHGPDVFITRMTAGPRPHGTPLVKLADITVDVAGKHGAGSVVLTRGGSVFRRAATGQLLGNLVFTYRAEGRMAKEAQVQVTIPQGWTSPHLETVDGVDSPGEVSISDNANLNVTGGGGRPWKLTATTKEPLDADGTIVFNYKSVTAPGAAGSYTFETHQTSFKGALHIDNVGAGLASSWTVGIGQAPDGAGTMTVAKSAAPAFSTDATVAYLANAGEALGNLTFTYTAAGTMQAGASVSLEIPEPWTQPVLDNDDSEPTPGETVVAGTDVVGADVVVGTVVGRVITATVSTEIVSGESFTVTYKNVNAPTAIGEYDFTAQSKSTAIGQLKNLSEGSPTIKVGQVPVGVVSISTIDADGMSMPLVAAGPKMPIGNVTITYKATARVTKGAKVMITVPAGWSAPNEDNDDGEDVPGEVVITGSASVDVTGGGGQPWMLVATTNDMLESGDTLVFIYKNVTTPSTEDSYTFTTVASISATSTPVAIAVQQSVIVRTMVDAIAIAADDSFFAGDSLSGMVTLWGGMAAANALGDVVVMLSSDSETGSFTADSITIADNTNGAAFTYNDTAPGPVMLTATSGDGDAAMTTTKEVTVKSGVADFDVDPTLVKAGSDVKVTATGKAGGGTVKVMDSEGMQVGATKSLDPIVEPEDGDVTYSRTITLPADLPDGTYTVTVDIQGLIDTMDIEVVNDQDPPTLSNANVLPTTVANGALLTLTVKATASSAINPVESVTADVSAVDSTQKDMVELTAQPGTDNTYFAIHTISMNNTNDDGVVDVSFTATDRIGGEGTATASVTLANDVTVIESVNVPSDMFRPGDTVTITATGTPGGAAFLSVLTGADDVLVDKKAMTEDPDGTYTGSFPVVADVFPEGTYYVTVNLNTKSTSTTGLNIGPAGYTFTLSIPAGIHAIHIPLAANMINGEDGKIETVGDVYDALGDAVRYIISLNANGNWISYLGDENAGAAADAAIGDDTGLIAVMKSARSIELVGDALGTGGKSMVNINVGNNLVGLPLKPAAGLSMISDLLVDGVGAIAVSKADGMGFHTIIAAGDSGDGPVMGGVGYIVVYTGAEETSIPIVGSAWENSGAVMAGPAVAFSGSQTPVLHVDGSVMDEFDMLSRIPELRVTVRNLSTGASLDTVLGTEQSATAYSATFVEFGRHAAKAGDVLEIVAHSPNPYVGVRPVPQIVVSAEEVLTSRISLPDMELYEIPSESELLANYPNPFNPETWIPYRLAKAAEVTLDIYDTNGRLVRTIDIGFKPAAVYESRASAIYWDGRNNYGERVASGTYFYHLTAGDDYASTRRMVILK